MERARAVMPGGNTRTTAYYAPFPLAIARADGPYLWDVDGNQLIDLLMNYTSLVHGHRFPPAMAAVEQTLARGTVWPAPSEEQVALAELLCGRIDSVDQVRFCNSGTEAGMLAVRVARKATGRRKVLKAFQGYHGSYSELEAGPETLHASFGDLEGFREAIAGYGSGPGGGRAGAAAGGRRRSARRVPRGRRGGRPRCRRGAGAGRGDHPASGRRRRAADHRHPARPDDDGQADRRRLPGRRPGRPRRPDGRPRSPEARRVVPLRARSTGTRSRAQPATRPPPP